VAGSPPSNTTTSSRLTRNFGLCPFHSHVLPIYFFNPQDDRTNRAGSGFQLPRLSTAQRLALFGGDERCGLQVFDITIGTIFSGTGLLG